MATKEPTPTEHGSLVNSARIWLRKRRSRKMYHYVCPPSVVITTEVAGGESADAIGFTAGGLTTLIECKTSRSDFSADAKKYFRRDPERGMGAFRFFLTQPGLISRVELPINWGLLESRAGKIKCVWPSGRFERNTGAETQLLISCLRRIGKHAPNAGMIISFYTYETKCRATLGVAP
jgi:hypothetical protein